MLALDCTHSSALTLTHHKAARNPPLVSLASECSTGLALDVLAAAAAGALGTQGQIYSTGKSVDVACCSRPSAALTLLAQVLLPTGFPALSSLVSCCRSPPVSGAADPAAAAAAAPWLSKPVVSANHFDADAVLSIWVLLNREEALTHDAGAQRGVAGDVRRWPEVAGRGCECGCPRCVCGVVFGCVWVCVEGGGSCRCRKQTLDGCRGAPPTLNLCCSPSPRPRPAVLRHAARIGDMREAALGDSPPGGAGPRLGRRRGRRRGHRAPRAEAVLLDEQARVAWRPLRGGGCRLASGGSREGPGAASPAQRCACRGPQRARMGGWVGGWQRPQAPPALPAPLHCRAQRGPPSPAPPPPPCPPNVRAASSGGSSPLPMWTGMHTPSTGSFWRGWGVR